MRKSVVIYYSQTGVTKAIADAVSERYGSDVYFVEPKEAYGSFVGSVVRAGREMIGKKVVEVTTPVADLDGAEVVFVGFPIWCGGVPHFMKGYLKRCEIGERIVVPFATSSYSGIDKAVKSIREIAPQARVRRPFLSTAKKKGDLERWLEALDGQMGVSATSHRQSRF